MNAPFFITGFPRSRTAWLANLFTYGRARCYHDITATGLTAQQLMRRESRPGQWRGISDPILVLMHQELIKEFPNARWLYVDRARDTCEASYARYIAKALPQVTADQIGQLFDQQERLAEVLKLEANVRCVRYEDLDRYGAICGAWYHLIPDQPFDLDRWKMLVGMNVQSIPERSLVRTKGVS